MAYSYPLNVDRSSNDALAVNKITVGDLSKALRLGFRDFWDNPSHYVFLCLIYPVIGVVLVAWSSRTNVLPLIYPLISGFALLGPFAAIGLYELSHQREKGADVGWKDAFNVLKSPALGSIAIMAMLLFVLFTLWLTSAQSLYQSLYGDVAPTSLSAFINDVFGTQRGWTLLLIGNALGLIFAVIVLSITIVSFPLMVDRNVTIGAAIQTSIAAVAANPVPILVWGIIVAFLMALGTLPFFLGLAIVLPVLGHATWHLYRMLVPSDA